MTTTTTTEKSNSTILSTTTTTATTTPSTLETAIDFDDSGSTSTSTTTDAADISDDDDDGGIRPTSDDRFQQQEKSSSGFKPSFKANSDFAGDYTELCVYVELDDLQYRFPVSDNLRLWVGTNSLSNHNVLDHGNPYLISSGSGALSRFGRRNPLIFRTVSGAGVGANVKLGKALKFNAAYLSSDAADPSESEGLFNGSYSASGQIVIEPTDNFKLNFADLVSFFALK